MSDAGIAAAAAQIEAIAAKKGQAPVVQSFFDEATFTISHIVYDPISRRAAIIDSVRDFDPVSGRTAYDSAQALVDYIRCHNLHVTWILETHAHADHLSAAPWLKEQLGGAIGIGADITLVQDKFRKIFNADDSFACDGSQFDQLFHDSATFSIGELPVIVLHVPGHTPADVAYVIGDAIFVGDTLFMPDFGTARTDFPGGDAKTLYRSIRRLLSLPPQTRVLLCHDYKAPGRDHYAWETTIGEQKDRNVHVAKDISEQRFVEMRTQRDATLSLPNLIIPSIQVNMRAGHLPKAESNGVHYIKVPIDQF